MSTSQATANITLLFDPGDPFDPAAPSLSIFRLATFVAPPAPPTIVKPEDSGRYIDEAGAQDPIAGVIMESYLPRQVFPATAPESPVNLDPIEIPVMSMPGAITQVELAADVTDISVAAQRLLSSAGGGLAQPSASGASGDSVVGYALQQGAAGDIISVLFAPFGALP